MTVRYVLLDGHRRLLAAKHIGLLTLDAVILPGTPTPSEAKVAQFCIAYHHADFSQMEKSNSLADIVRLKGWTQSDLVRELDTPQPTVSRLLGYQRLSPAIQELLHRGELDSDKAFVLSQEPDHAKQQELLSIAKNTPRAQLRRRIRLAGQVAEPKASVARFAVAGGFQITVQGNDLTLAKAISVLQRGVKELKLGLSRGLNITTQEQVMNDTSKAAK